MVSTNQSFDRSINHSTGQSTLHHEPNDTKRMNERPNERFELCAIVPTSSFHLRLWRLFQRVYVVSTNQSFDRSINHSTDQSDYTYPNTSKERTRRNMATSQTIRYACLFQRVYVVSTNQSFDRSINHSTGQSTLHHEPNDTKRMNERPNERFELCAIVPTSSFHLRLWRLFQRVYVVSTNQSFDRSINHSTVHISKYVRIPQHEGGPGVRSINRSINRSIGRPINQTAHIQIRPDTTA